MGLFRKKQSDTKTRQPQLMAGQSDYLFRRSRTLVGSPSSEVRAAAESSASLQSPRLKAHQLRQHRRGLIGALCGVLLVAAILSWLDTQYVRLPNDIQYSQPISSQPTTNAYLATVNDYFVGHPFERFLFSTNQTQLSHYVHDKHPEVEQVSIYQSGLINCDIAVSLRQPVAVWRIGGREEYVDKDGEAFYTNYFASPAVAVEDQSGINTDALQVVVSNRFIAFMGQLVNAVNQQHIGDVKTIIIPRGTTREIDITLVNKSYAIKTHIDRTPASQAADIASAVKFLDSRHIVPQYLDNRVPGKAYYR